MQAGSAAAAAPVPRGRALEQQLPLRLLARERRRGLEIGARLASRPSFERRPPHAQQRCSLPAESRRASMDAFEASLYGQMRAMHCRTDAYEDHAAFDRLQSKWTGAAE